MTKYKATGAPPWAAIVIVGVIGTGYTTVGGMKAVVWTDAFQSLVMVAGLIAVCVLGAGIVGGMDEVIKIATDWGRLDINTTVDLTTRFSFLSILFGYTNYWIGAYGINQPCSQRYCAMENMKKAKLTVLLNGPGFVILNSLAMLTGTVAFAYYTTKGCDPIRANIVDNANQIVPYFVMEVLAYPGLPGIFISSLFSASLSTLSSSINSMAAVTWEDIFKERYHTLAPERQALFTKSMVVVYGVVCIIVSFLVLAVGGNLVQISASFFGATIGPLFGLFVLGALFPWANWKGALTGGITGISVSLWVMFGQVSAKLQRNTLPTPIHNCWNTTEAYNLSTVETQWQNTTMHSIVEDEPQGFLHSLYSVSFTWFSFSGTVLVILIGLLISLCTGGNDTENMDPSVLFICLRRRYGKHRKEDENEWVYTNEVLKQNGTKDEMMDITKL